MEDHWLESLIAVYVFLIIGTLIAIAVSCFTWWVQDRRAQRTAERNRVRNERELAAVGRRVRAELYRERVMKQDPAIDNSPAAACRIRPGSRGMEISMEEFEELFGRSNKNGRTE